jgi:hypothetical protein
LIDEQSIIETWVMPVIGKTYDLGGIARICKQLADVGVLMVMVERQQPAYNRGKAAASNSFVKASFGIGYGYALWQMGLYMAGVPHEVVMPQVWKRQMGVLAPSHIRDQKARQKAAKQASVSMCQQLYPNYDLRLNERCRVASPDKAESVLLARYGMLRANAA